MDNTAQTPPPTQEKIDLHKLDQILGQNKKLQLMLIPIVLIIIGLLIAGFLWYKHNFLDGRKENLKPFTSINYNVPYNLSIFKSDKNRIEISNNENPYYDKIDFFVENNELKIKNLPKISIPKRGAPEIVIYAQSVSQIINNDKGNIKVDKMEGGEIVLEMKDKGNIEVANITAKILKATVRNRGDIIVDAGRVDAIEANIVNSSGKINLEGVESPTAKTKDIGTGTIKLNANTVDETKEKTKSKK